MKSKEIIQKAQAVASILLNSGLPMKECVIVSKGKRMNYTRGDKLIEKIKENEEFLSQLYIDENSSAPIIVQKLLEDKMIIKLERIKEKKKLSWPQKLELSDVIY